MVFLTTFNYEIGGPIFFCANTFGRRTQPHNQSQFYNRFIPGNLPKLMINYVSGVVEILLGIGLLFTATKYWSAWGVFILMIVFLPLHVIDLFRDKPAIGSKPVAVVRLVIQFLLIWGAWWLLVPYL